MDDPLSVSLAGCCGGGCPKVHDAKKKAALPISLLHLGTVARWRLE